MNIYIKNMVCVRCKMAVQAVLTELDIKYSRVELGVATLAVSLSSEQLNQIDTKLKFYELELMEDRKKILVERIKTLIINIFLSANDDIRLKFSEYLSRSLHYDYTYLSNVFSELEGATIERFYIGTRIERVKELIVYEGLSVTEIAYILNYSSTSHLCLQFKKITGITPSIFRKRCESADYVWRIIK